MPAPADPAPADIPLPPTDRPALDDPTTALLLTGMARRITANRHLGFFLLVSLAIAVGTSLPDGTAARPASAYSAVVGVAAALLVLAWMVKTQLPLGRWLRSARRLLAAQAWRPVPATVISRRVVEVGADGERWQARVAGPLPDAVRQVITRAGRVWLVGPDADGWLSLRIDGWHEPLPGRRQDPVIMSVPGQSAPVTDVDPVTGSWAAYLARAERRWLWALTLGPALGLTGSRAMISGSVWGVVVQAAILAVLVAVAVAQRWRLWRDRRMLPGLLQAGPWTKVSAALRPWEAKPSGLANARGTMWLSDGGTVEITLREASVDLLGTMWETGAVWVAGEPVAGKTVAVGFPGYPLLAVARLS
jgi:hypothetical protein